VLVDVSPGDVVALVGKRRATYRVMRLEGNTETGRVWAVLFGGAPGRVPGIRHVELNQIRLVKEAGR
jgi:hypothetical protein